MRALAPTARVIAVIKANAYGHGLVPAAQALAAADAFAVARLEEGLALRAAGLTQRDRCCSKVCSCADQLDAAVQQGFDLVVHSPSSSRCSSSAGDGASCVLWLKIDTGMNRLGFRVEDFADAHARLLRIAGPRQRAARC